MADNIISLRKTKRLSQENLAKLAEIPRSTVTHIESGSGNPSLQNLIKLSLALQVGIEELLSRPRQECELRTAAQIPVAKRSQGKVRITKLLPDKFRGLDVDKIEIDRGAVMAGHPHLSGAKEYLAVLKGEMLVQVAGNSFRVEAGSVFAFPGDQPHSYRNVQPSDAQAISIVIPITLGTD